MRPSRKPSPFQQRVKAIAAQKKRRTPDVIQIDLGDLSTIKLDNPMFNRNTTCNRAGVEQALTGYTGVAAHAHDSEKYSYENSVGRCARIDTDMQELNSRSLVKEARASASILNAEVLPDLLQSHNSASSCGITAKNPNERPLLKNLEARYEYFVGSLEKLIPFMATVKGEYLAVRETHTALAGLSRRQAQRIAVLEKETGRHAGRIAGLTEDLRKLQETNARLKDKHRTFMLYKGEVSKYIELFKDSLRTRGEELKELQAENIRLKQSELASEYTIEALRSDTAAQQKHIDDMTEEKSLVETEMGLMRTKLGGVEAALSGLQNRCRALGDTRHAERCLLYQHTANEVKAESDELKHLVPRVVGVAQTLQRAYNTLHARIDAAARTEQQLRNRLSAIESELQAAKGDFQSARLQGSLEKAKAAASLEALGARACAAGELLRTRLHGLQNEVASVGSRINELAGGTAIGDIKQYFADLMSAQRKLFEAEKHKLMSRLKAHEEKEIKRKTQKRAAHDADSVDSNLWDIFK
ncbi:hypothetical protein PAPHI01_0266 [Pancytospora philotis]|nr:hypothetical protein PAPHI01_0266 [Pancytospora philotis]